MINYQDIIDCFSTSQPNKQTIWIILYDLLPSKTFPPSPPNQTRSMKLLYDIKPSPCSQQKKTTSNIVKADHKPKPLLRTTTDVNSTKLLFRHFPRRSAICASTPPGSSPRRSINTTFYDRFESPIYWPKLFPTPP